MVVFWKWIEQEDEETHEKKEVPFLRYYNVFHIDQCEGVSAKYTTEAAFPDGADTLAAAQDIIYDYAAKHIIHPMICRILFTSVRVGDALFFSEYVMGIFLFLPLIGGVAARAERAYPPDFPYWFLIMIPQKLLMLFSIIFVEKNRLVR